MRNRWVKSVHPMTCNANSRTWQTTTNTIRQHTPQACNTVLMYFNFTCNDCNLCFIRYLFTQTTPWGSKNTVPPYDCSTEQTYCMESDFVRELMLGRKYITPTNKLQIYESYEIKLITHTIFFPFIPSHVSPGVKRRFATLSRWVQSVADTLILVPSSFSTNTALKLYTADDTIFCVDLKRVMPQEAQNLHLHGQSVHNCLTLKMKVLDYFQPQLFTVKPR